MAERRTAKLAITSDLICGWCFINQRELETAIERCADLPIDFEIEHRPFRLFQRLNEDLPVDKTKYIQGKLGVEKASQAFAMLKARAEQLGLKLAEGGKISQTTRVHRLLLKALQKGGWKKQQELLTVLYNAHFLDGEHYGDTEFLATCAEKTRVLSKEAAIDFLESDDNEPEVKQMMEECRVNGVTGVPVTVMNGKWAISGCLDAKIYEQIFRKMATCMANSPCNAPATNGPKIMPASAFKDGPCPSEKAIKEAAAKEAAAKHAAAAQHAAAVVAPAPTPAHTVGHGMYHVQTPAQELRAPPPGMPSPIPV